MGNPIKALFSAIVFLFAGLFSTSVLAQEVPEDFEVVFTSSPALPSRAIDTETLTINSAGEVVLSPKVHFTGRVPNQTREVLFELHLVLDAEALARIFAAINENEFFTLNENYNDPNIMDGDWAELTITSGGQTRTVRTRNIKVVAFDRITVTINGQLPEERRLKYNAINGADYEEVER